MMRGLVMSASETTNADYCYLLDEKALENPKNKQAQIARAVVT